MSLIQKLIDSTNVTGYDLYRIVTGEHSVQVFYVIDKEDIINVEMLEYIKDNIDKSTNSEPVYSRLFDKVYYKLGLIPDDMFRGLLKSFELNNIKLAMFSIKRSTLFSILTIGCINIASNEYSSDKIISEVRHGLYDTEKYKAIIVGKHTVIIPI